MKVYAIIAASSILLTACTVVPYGTAKHACELLQIAATESDLAPAWYLRTGVILESCGQDRAKLDAEIRACFAESRNGYRDSKECESLP